MLQLDQTTTFKKCLKKYRHKKAVLKELGDIVELLIKEEPIPAKYKDHELQGKYKGIRELHLKPDDLLMYIKIEHQKITLVALSSHSELFSTDKYSKTKRK